MSQQGWQTITYNKPKKEKNEKKNDVVRFDPIPSRQREVQTKINADNLTKKQIQIPTQSNPNQDWNTITFTKPKPKQKIDLPQREQSAVKTNQSGDIVQVKKISSQMAKAIIDARVVKKWNQVQLAHNSAIDVKTISEVERGGGLYDANVFNKLCKTLGIVVERNCLIEKKNN